MTDTMPLDDYLAAGGVLTAPANVPPRVRGELLRLMATFVDSELAASAGFADTINAAPGITARIAACRITLEKADHAGRVLALMGEFGADTARYARQHTWADRLPRDGDLSAARRDDMRLPVFHFPLAGWTDAVVMNVLQGLAAGITFAELSHVSYAPLADAFRAIAPREARHTELGLAGVAAILATADGRARTAASVAYWMPKVAAGFGPADPARFETLKRFGLRRRPAAALRADWEAAVRALLAPFDL